MMTLFWLFVILFILWNFILRNLGWHSCATRTLGGEHGSLSLMGCILGHRDSTSLFVFGPLYWVGWPKSSEHVLDLDGITGVFTWLKSVRFGTTCWQVVDPALNFILCRFWGHWYFPWFPYNSRTSNLKLIKHLLWLVSGRLVKTLIESFFLCRNLFARHKWFRLNL